MRAANLRETLLADAYVKINIIGRRRMTNKWGAIVIDIQGDFTKWKQGSLAVPGSDEGYVKSAEIAARQLHADVAVQNGLLKAPDPLADAADRRQKLGIGPGMGRG